MYINRSKAVRYHTFSGGGFWRESQLGSNSGWFLAGMPTKAHRYRWVCTGKRPPASSEIWQVINSSAPTQSSGERPTGGLFDNLVRLRVLQQRNSHRCSQKEMGEAKNILQSLVLPQFSRRNHTSIKKDGHSSSSATSTREVSSYSANLDSWKASPVSYVGITRECLLGTTP